MPANNHFHPVVQFALDALGGAFPNDGANLRMLVFERQVAMPRGAVAAEVGNLAGDPGDGKGRLDDLFQHVGELRDGQHRQRISADLKVASHGAMEDLGATDEHG